MPFRRATVPTGIPLLRAGKHSRLEDGSCLMEYVSVLAGDRFTDRPLGTAPVLARLARKANDRIEAEIGTGRKAREVRQALLPLAPALADTAPDHVVRPVVLDHLTATALALAPDDRLMRRLRNQALTVRFGIGGPVRRARMRSEMAAATPAAFLRLEYLLQSLRPVDRNAEWIGLLTDVIDDLTGATPVRSDAAVLTG